MTWTAPDVTRPDPPTVSGERAALESWLDFQRSTLLRKCQGPDWRATGPPGRAALVAFAARARPAYDRRGAGLVPDARRR
ncbi:MAG: hypothetical protein ACLPKI_30835 [Streptosporangiaceae bacterium]